MMKNKTLGLVYAISDALSSATILVGLGIATSHSVSDMNEGYEMGIVLPLLVNAPVSLIAVPFLGIMDSYINWIFVVFGISLGVIQNYYLGYITAWAYKSRKVTKRFGCKVPKLFGYAILLFLCIWSAFIWFYLLLSFFWGITLFFELAG